MGLGLGERCETLQCCCLLLIEVSQSLLHASTEHCPQLRRKPVCRRGWRNPKRDELPLRERCHLEANDARRALLESQIRLGGRDMREGSDFMNLAREEGALEQRRRAMNARRGGGGGGGGGGRGGGGGGGGGGAPLSRREYYAELQEFGDEESYALALEAWARDRQRLAQRRAVLEGERGLMLLEEARLHAERESRFGALPTLPPYGADADRFLLLGLLAKGGSSEVWRAVDLRKGHEVAIKVHQLVELWPERQKQDYVLRTMREFMFHKQLQHGNIVCLAENEAIEISQNCYAMALDLCRGRDLGRLLLQRGGALPEREARTVIAQVLAALRYLHGYSARDIEAAEASAAAAGAMAAGASVAGALAEGASAEGAAAEGAAAAGAAAADALAEGAAAADASAEGAAAADALAEGVAAADASAQGAAAEGVAAEDSSTSGALAEGAAAAGAAVAASAAMGREATAADDISSDALASDGAGHKRVRIADIGDRNARAKVAVADSVFAEEAYFGDRPSLLRYAQADAVAAVFGVERAIADADTGTGGGESVSAHSGWTHAGMATEMAPPSSSSSSSSSSSAPSLSYGSGATLLPPLGAGYSGHAAPGGVASANSSVDVPAHRRRFIYYNLKLANILIDEDFTVKVTGLGHLLSDTGLPGSAGNMAPVNDASSFLPPECFPAHEATSVAPGGGRNKVDVWSLGVIFFRMLYGRLPNVVPPPEADARVLRRGPECPAQDKSGAKVSLGARRFIERCLSLSHADRPDVLQISMDPYLRAALE